jgi:hypothetical protein
MTLLIIKGDQGSIRKVMERMALQSTVPGMKGMGARLHMRRSA